MSDVVFPTVEFKRCDGEDPHVMCVIVADGNRYSAKGSSCVEAMANASVLALNAECQAFNRKEYDHQQADRKNYSIPSELRYRARRRSPVALVTTDRLLDISMFYSQMRIFGDNFSRAVRDNEEIFDEMKKRNESIAFMA